MIDPTILWQLKQYPAPWSYRETMTDGHRHTFMIDADGETIPNSAYLPSELICAAINAYAEQHSKEIAAYLAEKNKKDEWDD